MELRSYDAWQGQPRAVAGEGEGRGGGTSEPLGEGAQNGMGSGLGGRKPGCQRGPRLAPQPPLMQKPQFLSSETPGQGRTCAGGRITRGQCSGPAAQTLEGSPWAWCAVCVHVCVVGGVCTSLSARPAPGRTRLGQHFPLVSQNTPHSLPKTVTDTLKLVSECAGRWWSTAEPVCFPRTCRSPSRGHQLRVSPFHPAHTGGAGQGGLQAGGARAERATSPPAPWPYAGLSSWMYEEPLHISRKRQ